MKRRLSSLRLVRGRQTEFLDNLKSQNNLRGDLEAVRDSVNRITEGKTDTQNDVAIKVQNAESSLNEALETLSKLTEAQASREFRAVASYFEIKELCKCFVEAGKVLKTIPKNKAAEAKKDLDRVYVKMILKDFNDSYNEHCSLLRNAITTQIARVRMMETKRSDNSAIAGAEARLGNLKGFFLEDTGSEWSNIRLEGPTVLTRNEVKGDEMDTETKEILKHYRRQNVLR